MTCPSETQVFYTQGYSDKCDTSITSSFHIIITGPVYDTLNLRMLDILVDFSDNKI